MRTFAPLLPLSPEFAETLETRETGEDFQLIFAPGSYIGGANPKASVIDLQKHLSFTKFEREKDDYTMETWEKIALRLAAQSGINTTTANGRPREIR
jgi:serine/threonine-protein kinase HipA